MKQPFLASIQIGKPQTYGTAGAVETHDKPWTTGFFKSPVEGPVRITRTGPEGDGQADLKNHGGIDKAVLAYSANHYPKWRQELHQPDMPFGAFGENLTIAELTEETVNIGDLYRIGPVLFEVSQPRQPCWKLARRWRMNELVAYVIQNGRTGWYFRVLEEGTIQKEMPVTLLNRPNPQWPISRANQIMYHAQTDAPLTLALAAVPKLAQSWVQELQERFTKLRARETSV